MGSLLYEQATILSMPCPTKVKPPFHRGWIEEGSPYLSSELDWNLASAAGINCDELGRGGGLCSWWYYLNGVSIMLSYQAGKLQVMF